MLRLQTFGACFLERDGVRVETASAYRKGLALLAVLAAAGERGVSRDAALALLWPESDEERARTSLRQVVHLLRNQLHAPELLAPTPELRLNPQAISSDVADFRGALANEDFVSAAALYRGPFLDGFYVRGTDELERWIAAERASLASDAARAVEALARRAELQGDLPAAVGWWRRLTELEPISARAAVGLMRCLDAAGERAAALRHARVHELLVEDELGEAPDGSVAAFADALRISAPPDLVDAAAATAAVPAGGDVPGSPGVASAPAGHDAAGVRSAGGPVVPDSPGTAAVPAGRDAAGVRPAGGAGEPDSPVVPAVPDSSSPRLRGTPAAVALILALLALVAATGLAIATLSRGEPHRSLAVLPLSNTSGDADDDVISDGLTENLIASLATVPDVRVIGRTSAFRFRERTLDLRAIADSLDVGAVLDGSLQRSGEQLKVSVQLVSAADGTVIWAETYDRQMRDFFAVQDEITRAIVDALRLRLGIAAPPTTTPTPPRTLRDVEAYELYLRGRHIFALRTDREGIDQARRYFEAALARDSLLAHAHAGLSDVHTRLAIFGYVPARDGFRRAKEHALRALALDGTLAEAHAALGHALCVADFAWEAADRAFERAIALNPSYTFGRMPYAICLMARSRFRDAERQLLEARDFDPLSPAPSNLLGRLYVNMRLPDRAIENLRQALELSPQMDLAWQQLGHAYLQKGMDAEAVDALERAAALSGARDSAHLAYAYAVTGRSEDARRILDLLAAPPGRSSRLAYHLALAHTGLGDFDRAFAWLERGFEEQGSFMATVSIDPALAPLHEDPRWAAVVGRLGLE